MRRDDAIGRVPQRVVFGQGFRIRDIERGASEAASAVASVQGVVVAVGSEGGDEICLDEDLSAGDIRHESVFRPAEDCELLGAEEVGRFFCQRDADEEVVDVLCEEVVQAGFIEAAEPFFRDGAVRVAGAGDDEALVVFGFGCCARRGGVRDDVHSHAAGDAGDLAADAAVAEDAESFARVVPEALEFLAVGVLAPFVVALPCVEEGVVVGVGEGGEDDPFGDLGAVDAGGGGQGDGGVCVDGGVGDVVRAGGEEVDEVEVGAGFWAWREGGERGEDGGVFVDFCGGFNSN